MLKMCISHEDLRCIPWSLNETIITSNINQGWHFKTSNMPLVVPCVPLIRTLAIFAQCDLHKRSSGLKKASIFIFIFFKIIYFSRLYFWRIHFFNISEFTNDMLLRKLQLLFYNKQYLFHVHNHK